QPAPMPLLEFHHVGKPAQRIAEGAHRDLDQYLAPGCRIVVTEYVLVLLPDLEPEPNEIALGAVHRAGLHLGLEQDIASIEIAEAHLPRMLARRETNPAALIEIEAHALGALLRRDGSRLGIRRLGGRLRRGLRARNRSGIRNRRST